MAGSTKQKAVSGVMWASVQKFTGMGLFFISGIILARLLLPSDYGCIGMLSIFMVIANSFIDGGFGSALIQKKQPTQEDYSTIFFFNLGMSFLMYVILFFSAPAIARFYNMPLLSSVLRVQGLILFLNAFALIQNNQLRKQFKFKKIAIVSLVSSFVALIVTIVLAYNGYGVWSLVATNLTGASLSTLIFWVTNKWRPLLRFSAKSFKELFNFGFFMFLTNMVNNICNNVQGLLIGKIYNPSTMGFYSKARGTEEIASTTISHVMGQVTYPLYAEYQNDIPTLISIIKKITITISYITFPLMLLLILLAEPIFVLLYSDRWLGSVPYFQILCLAGIAICLQGVNYQAIAAIGKSKVMFSWTLIKRAIGLALIVGGLAAFGMKGLLIGMVMQSWLINLINAYQVHKHIGYKLFMQLFDIVPILLLSLFSFAVSYCLSFLLPDVHMYVLAIIRFIVFFVVYIAGSLLFKMAGYKNMMEMLPLIFSKKNRNKIIQTK